MLLRYPDHDTCCRRGTIRSPDGLDEYGTRGLDFGSAGVE